MNLPSFLCHWLRRGRLTGLLAVLAWTLGATPGPAAPAAPPATAPHGDAPPAKPKATPKTGAEAPHAEATPVAPPPAKSPVPAPRAEVANQIAEGLVNPDSEASTTKETSEFAPMLEEARKYRREGDRARASHLLSSLLDSTAPSEVKRPAMMEMAMVSQDEGNLSRAQQILSQYIQLNPQHPTIVEAYLRQGMIYRQMGATGLAIAKFYSVMTSALNLRLEQLEYYQRLVLQAQTEIADTYYLEGRWEEAKDFLNRLLKMDSPHLNRSQVHFKLVRTFAAMGKPEQTVAQGLAFITRHPDAAEVPEVRFLVASAFKKQGRNDEALRQVLLLLESQQAVARENPQSWSYWQKRAGNEIANQLYQEGDFLGTLEIYQHLAGIDSSGPWQVPVWYQIGLVYERLQQPEKARGMFTNILARELEVTGTNGTPGLQAVVDMARWRLGHLSWLQNAQAQSTTLLQSTPASLSPPPAHVPASPPTQ